MADRQPRFWERQEQEEAPDSRTRTAPGVTGPGGITQPRPLSPWELEDGEEDFAPSAVAPAIPVLPGGGDDTHRDPEPGGSEPSVDIPEDPSATPYPPAPPVQPAPLTPAPEDPAAEFAPPPAAPTPVPAPAAPAPTPTAPAPTPTPVPPAAEVNPPLTPEPENEPTTPTTPMPAQPVPGERASELAIPPTFPQPAPVEQAPQQPAPTDQEIPAAPTTPVPVIGPPDLAGEEAKRRRDQLATAQPLPIARIPGPPDQPIPVEVQDKVADYYRRREERAAVTEEIADLQYRMQLQSYRASVDAALDNGRTSLPVIPAADMGITAPDITQSDPTFNRDETPLETVEKTLAGLDQLRMRALHSRRGTADAADYSLSEYGEKLYATFSGYRDALRRQDLVNQTLIEDPAEGIVDNQITRLPTPAFPTTRVYMPGASEELWLSELPPDLQEELRPLLTPPRNASAGPQLINSTGQSIAVSRTFQSKNRPLPEFRETDFAAEGIIAPPLPDDSNSPWNRIVRELAWTVQTPISQRVSGISTPEDRLIQSVTLTPDDLENVTPWTKSILMADVLLEGMEKTGEAINNVTHGHLAPFIRNVQGAGTLAVWAMAEKRDADADREAGVTVRPQSKISRILDRAGFNDADSPLSVIEKANRAMQLSQSDYAIPIVTDMVLDPTNWIPIEGWAMATGRGLLRGAAKIGVGEIRAITASLKPLGGTAKAVSSGLELLAMEGRGISTPTRFALMNESLRLRGLPRVEDSDPIFRNAYSDINSGRVVWDDASAAWLKRTPGGDSVPAPWNDTFLERYPNSASAIADATRAAQREAMPSFPLHRTGDDTLAVPEHVLSMEGVRLPKSLVLPENMTPTRGTPLMLSAAPSNPNLETGAVLWDVETASLAPKVYRDRAAYLEDLNALGGGDIRRFGSALKEQGFDSAYIAGHQDAPGAFLVLDPADAHLTNPRVITPDVIQFEATADALIRQIHASGIGSREAVMAAVREGELSAATAGDKSAMLVNAQKALDGYSGQIKSLEDEISKIRSGATFSNLGDEAGRQVNHYEILISDLKRKQRALGEAVAEGQRELRPDLPAHPLSFVDRPYQITPGITAFRDALVGAFPRATREQVDGAMALVRANARVQGIDADEWVLRHVAGVRVGEALPENLDALFQTAKKPPVGYETAGKTLESFRTTNFLPVSVAAEILGGTRPEFLEPAIRFIAEQRRKLATGTLSDWDTAKAYLLTLSSINGKAQPLATLQSFLERSGSTFRIPEGYSSLEKGVETIRPEEAMAAWITSAEGQAARRAVEAGAIPEDAFAGAENLRGFWGTNTVRNWGNAVPGIGEFNLRNISDFTRAVNAAGTDSEELGAVVRNLKGIRNAKEGFVKHLLGLGDTPTIDAREINFWLTGSGDIRGVASEAADLARGVGFHQKSDKFAGEVSSTLRQKIRELTVELRQRGLLEGVDDESAAHIVHHWIWDRSAGSETTHSSLYGAMGPLYQPGGGEGIGSAVTGKSAGLVPPPAPTPAPIAPPFYLKSAQVVDSPAFLKRIPGATADPRRITQAFLDNGVTKEEMRWTGLDSWLADHTRRGERASVEDLKKFIAENDIQVKVVENSSRQYASLTVPGGENYRELLLTRPIKTTETPRVRIVEVPRSDGRVLYSAAEYSPSGNFNGYVTGDYDSRAAAELARERYLAKYFPELNSAVNNPIYRGPHFSEPNVVAHVRLTDRIDPKTGKKTLFIEEVQSDWHQTGQKTGYADPAKAEEVGKKVQELSDRLRYWEMSPEEEQARRLVRRLEGDIAPEKEIDDAWEKWNEIREQNGYNALYRERENLEAQLGNLENGPPPGPFSDSWPELSLKRMIRHAAENGYDSISWTPGKIHADRYAAGSEKIPGGMEAFYDKRLVDTANSLSKRFGGAEARVERGAVSADRTLFERGDIRELADAVRQGNPEAARLLEELSESAAGPLSNRGMETSIYVTARQSGYSDEAADTALAALAKAEPRKSADAYTLAITPTMKRSAMESGFPMFQAEKSTVPAKGMVNFLDDGRAVITAFKSGDISTISHELGHIFRRDLPDADMALAAKWANNGKPLPDPSVWTEAMEERFSRGFERYLATGTAPTPELAGVFAKFKEWLTDIYRQITGSAIDIDLSDDIKGVYDRLFRTEGDQAAEAGTRGGLSSPPVLRQPLDTPPPQGGATTADIADMHQNPPPAPSLTERMGDPSGKWRKVQEMFSDQMAGMNNLQYQWERQNRGVFNPVSHQAETVISLKNGGAGAGMQYGTEMLQEVKAVVGNLKGWKGFWGHLGTYMQMQHAIDVDAATKAAHPMADRLIPGNVVDPQWHLTNLEQNLSPDQWSKLQVAAQTIVRHGNMRLQRLVEAGVVNPDLAAELQKRYPHYAPVIIARYVDEGGAQSLGRGPRVSLGTTTLRKLKEGTEEVELQPVEAMLQSMLQAEVAIGRNHAARAVVDTAEDLGIAVKLPPNATSLPRDHMTVMVNGEPVHYAVPPWMAREAEILSSAASMGDWQKLAGYFYKTLRATTITYNPTFPLGNFTRDALTVMMTQQVGLGDYARGIKDAFQDVFGDGNKLMDEYRKLGGGQSGFYGRTPAEEFEQVRSAGRREFTPPKEIRSLSDLGRMINRPWEFGDTATGRHVADVVNLLPKFGEALEQSSRMAVFRANLSRRGIVVNGSGTASSLASKKTLNSDQWETALKEAAFQARRSTIDFQRTGAGIKTISSLYFVLNPSIQGSLIAPRAMYAGARTVRDQLTGNATISDIAHQGANAALDAGVRGQTANAYRTAISTAALTAAAAGTTWYNSQYPEYYKVPFRDRMGAMVMLPSNTPDFVEGGMLPNYIKIIPAMGEWAVPYGLTVFALEKLLDKNPAPIQRALKELFPKALPVTNFGQLIPTSPIHTGVEMAANFNFFKDRPIVSDELAKKPKPEQYDRYTPRVYRELGRMTGQSPMMLEHFFNGIFGGGARLASTMLSGIIDSASPIPVSAELLDLYQKFQAIPANDRVAQRKFTSALTEEQADAIYEMSHAPNNGLGNYLISKFYAPKSGDYQKLGTELAEALTGKSAEQTRDYGRVLGNRIQEIQQGATADSQKVMGGGMSWKDFAQAEHDRIQQIQGTLGTLNMEYPEAAQVDKTVYRQWLETVATVGHSIPDRRTRGQLLAAVWNSIPMTTEDDGQPDYDTFFTRREHFLSQLDAEDKQALEDERTATHTPARIQRDADMEVIRGYWKEQDRVAQKYSDWEQSNLDLRRADKGTDPYRKITSSDAAKQLEKETSKARDRYRREHPEVEAALTRQFGLTPLTEKDAKELKEAEGQLANAERDLTIALVRLPNNDNPDAQESIANLSIARDNVLRKVRYLRGVVKAPAYALSPTPIPAEKIPSVSASGVISRNREQIMDQVAQTFYRKPYGEDAKVDAEIADFMKAADKMAYDITMATGSPVATLLRVSDPVQREMILGLAFDRVRKGNLMKADGKTKVLPSLPGPGQNIPRAAFPAMVPPAVPVGGR